MKMKKGASMVVYLVSLTFLLFKGIDGLKQEVCASTWEAFSAECDSGKVIKLNSAYFGRMRVGRCLTSEAGSIGCGADVLPLLDLWCSGKKRCTVQLPSKDLDTAVTGVCSSQFIRYLEVDYECYPVLNADVEPCRGTSAVTLEASAGSLSSLEAGHSNCGSASSPIKIKTAPGQRINISMLDFEAGPQTEQHSNRNTLKCNYGYILERQLGINRTLCGGTGREKQVYVSTSNHVEIVMSPRNTAQQNRPSYLVHFKVVGCPDAVPPPNAWYKRNGDTAEIGCQWSDVTWDLKCEGDQWIGQIGNCSAQGQSSAIQKEDDFGISPDLSMWMITGLGLAVFILLIITVAGFTHIKRRRKQLTCQKPPHQPQAAAPPVSHQPTLPLYAQVRKDPSRANTMQPQPQSTTVNRQQPSIADTTLPPPPTGVDLLRLCNSTLPPNREGELYENTVDGRPWVDTSTVQASTENSRGQQFNSEGDYLIPCHTGTPAAVRAANSIYDTVGVRPDSEVASNDDYWVAESNFEFYSPKKN